MIKVHNCTTAAEYNIKNIDLGGMPAKAKATFATNILEQYKGGVLQDENIVIDALYAIILSLSGDCELSESVIREYEQVKRKSPTRLKKADIELMEEQLASGMPISEVAKIFDVTEDTVRRRFKGA